MSTSAIVAVPDADGTIHGRHISGDGYDDHMVPTLQALIARDGYETVKQRLMSRSEWSYLSATETSSDQSGNRMRVPGYGAYYTDSHGSLIPSKEFGSWASWVYVLYPDRIEIRYNGDVRVVELPSAKPAIDYTDDAVVRYELSQATDDELAKVRDDTDGEWAAFMEDFGTSTDGDELRYAADLRDALGWLYEFETAAEVRTEAAANRIPRATLKVLADVLQNVREEAQYEDPSK